MAPKQKDIVCMIQSVNGCSLFYPMSDVGVENEFSKQEEKQCVTKQFVELDDLDEGEPVDEPEPEEPVLRQPKEKDGHQSTMKSGLLLH